MFIPSDLTVSKLQTAEDLQGDALLHYDVEIEFVAKPVEALVSVYNRFAQLMNDLERNDKHFLIVTINTKFLNSLQSEWLKYVTQVRLAKRLTMDTFDDFFDYLQQFEKLVNTSRAKKLEKSHDPLAVVTHRGSSSRNTSSYYVTHPTSMVDYDDEYHQDDIQTNPEDPLASTMMLLARAITQNLFNPTNNRLRASSNTRNHAIIQGDKTVPQKELFVEQKYFPSSFIPSDKNSNATTSIPTSMPNNSLHAEIKQIKWKSIEIQKGLQARIKILEKDVQRCENQSVDFELKLQHEKEKHKWDSTLKNNDTKSLDYSWISKMEKLEHENVSFDFQVQSLIKERDNVKMKYQKLFDSIKKTQSQTQKEID
nr:hypothetical protein [Tanacetum cinerariifolium]